MASDGKSPLDQSLSLSSWRKDALTAVAKAAGVGVVASALLTAFHALEPAVNLQPLLGLIDALWGSKLKLLPAATFQYIQDRLWLHALFDGVWMKGVIDLLTFCRHLIWPAPDKDVIIPFPPLHAFDPLDGSTGILELDKKDTALPWQKPSGASTPIRQRAWDQLHQFAGVPFVDCRHKTWRRAEKVFDDFRWTVLSGRAGSGKTRMAIEFLKELARTDILNPDKRLTSESLKLRLGSWWRRTWPWATIGPNDPWDIAWIKPEYQGTGYKNRLQVHASNLDRLRAWKPRRPTAFLLDDPFDKDAEEVVRYLSLSSEKYRFPVRLIVINQTLVPGLGFEIQHNKVENGHPHYCQYIIELDEEARFTLDEIKNMVATPQVASRLITNQHLRKIVDEELPILFEITGGNPFLVELGLDRLLHGLHLKGFDALSLVADRADRIYKNLKRARPRITREGWQFLATATLAGRVQGQDDDWAWGDAAEQKLFRKEVSSLQDDLRLCLSLADTSRLPVVRPALVADAFVRLVMEQCCGSHAGDKLEEQQALVARAWKINPLGVLRTVERVAALDDDLGRAIRLGPPDNSNIPPVELAVEFATAAICYTPIQASSTDQRRSVIDVALTRILGLSQIDAWEAVDRITKLFVPSSTHANLYSGVGLACLVGAVENIVASAAPQPLELDQLEKIVERLEIVDARRRACLALLPPTRKVDVGETCAALAESFPTECNSPSTDWLRCRAWSLAYWGSRSFSQCVSACTQVDAISRAFDGDPDWRARFALERARAHQNVGFAYANRNMVDECVAQCTEVDVIGLAFKDDATLAPRFALERAAAHRNICRVYSGQEKTLNECLAAWAQVWAISAEFMHHADLAANFSFHRADATGDVANAYANANMIDECLSACVQVDAISADFKDDPDLAAIFALECSSAHAQLSYAYRSKVSECVAETASVDDITTEHRNHPELANWFAFSRASAHGSVCYAYAANGQVNQCVAAAALVDAISLDFRDDPSVATQLARERAAAHSYVCQANSTKETLTECVAACTQVEEISADYLEDPEFAQPRAIAYRAVCNAYAQDGATDKCLAAAEKVAEISRQFPKDDRVTYERQLVESIVAALNP